MHRKQESAQRIVLGLSPDTPAPLPTPSSPRARLARLGALLSLLLLPCLLFPGALPGERVVSADDHLSVHHGWQETPGGSIRHPQLSDPALQFKALRKRVVEALASGHAPLWNPDLHAGRPLLASGQGMVGSPVTWGRLLLPEDTAQDFGVWFVLAWTGLGTGLLLQRLGAGPLGITAGGIAAGIGPYPMVWLLHPHAATFAWVPWLLWATERRSTTLLALACLGLVGGGHPETAAHGLLFAGAWSLVRARDARVIKGFVIGGLLSAPLWLPLAELLSRSATFGAHGGNTLATTQLLDALVPNLHGHPAGDGYTGGGVWADGVVHPGLVALFLSVWGVRRSGLSRWLLGAWVLCLGAAWVGLPGPMNHARLGGMGALWIAVAAGLSTDRLPRSFATAALMGILGSGIWARHLDQGSLAPERHDPTPAPWTQVLSELTGEGRVAGLGWALQPNTGALVGLKDLRGYDLPVPASWERVARRLDPRLARPWYPIEQASAGALNQMRFAAVRYVLSETPIGPLPTVDVGPAPLGVYALAPGVTRAWMTHVTTEAPSAEAALDRVSRDRIARQRPPVEGLSALRGTPGTTPLTLTHDEPWLVGIKIPPITEPSLVVLSDTWDPHWQALVNGEWQDVLRVGGSYRGVLIQPGTDRVEFQYRYWPWALGLKLALLGLIGLVVSAARRRR